MLKRFCVDKAGNVAMMFGLFIIPILVGVGVAIDMLRANAARSELLQAADAGILAAARASLLDGDLSAADAQLVARRYFDGNQAITGNVIIDSFDFVHDVENDLYTLSIVGRIETSILGVIGQDFLPIQINSEARAKPAGPVEVVMVLDNTGSMEGTKLSSLMDSATLLTDALLQTDSGLFRVGLVPFAEYVNVGAGNDGESWVSVPPLAGSDVWNGCVGSRDYPDNINDGGFSGDAAPGILNVPCPRAAYPLTDNKDDITTEIDAMTATGDTYIPGGLSWGFRLLSSEEPFTEGKTFSETDTQNGVKAIVLLTDGANTISPTYPLHDSSDPTDANALTIEMCDEIKSEDVRIYAIAFEVDDTATEAMLQNCASEDGGYFDAGNSASLEAAFSTIATDLIQLALSK